MTNSVWILFQIWGYNEAGCFACGSIVGLEDTEERLGIFSSEEGAKKERDRLIKDYSRKLDGFRIEEVEVIE